MKSLSIYLLAVGVLWALTVVWIWLALSGIAAPEFAAGVLFGLVTGPVFLIVGPIFTLSAWYPRVGTVLTLVGCAILTIYVAYDTASLFHVEPLQPRPHYFRHLFIWVVTLLSDLAAIQLCRLVFSLSKGSPLRGLSPQP